MAGTSAPQANRQQQQAENARQESAYEREAASALNEFENLLVGSDPDFSPASTQGTPAPVATKPQAGKQQAVEPGAGEGGGAAEDGGQRTEDGMAGGSGELPGDWKEVEHEEEQTTDDGGQRTEDGAGEGESAEGEHGAGEGDGAEAGESDQTGESRNRAQERINEITREKHEWREKAEQLEARLAQIEQTTNAQANLLQEPDVAGRHGASAGPTGDDPYAEQIARQQKVVQLAQQNPDGYQEGNQFYSADQLAIAANNARDNIVGLRAQQAVWQQQHAQQFAANEAHFRNLASQHFPFLTKGGSPEHLMAKQLLQQLGPTVKKYANWPVVIGSMAEGLVRINKAVGATSTDAAGASSTHSTGSGSMTAAGTHRNGSPAPVPGAGSNPQGQQTSPQPRRPRAPQVGAGGGGVGAPRTSGGAARAGGNRMQAFLDAAGTNEDAETAAIMNLVP